jgi:hypothetical protein
MQGRPARAQPAGGPPDPGETLLAGLRARSDEETAHRFEPKSLVGTTAGTTSPKMHFPGVSAGKIPGVE